MTDSTQETASPDAGVNPQARSWKSSAVGSLVGGVVGGVVGSGASIAGGQFGQDGLVVRVFIVLISLLLAGMVAGPWQRHQLGGSAAAMLALGILFITSFALNRPIAAQTLLSFQLQTIAAISLLCAILLGGGAASLWTHPAGKRSK